MTLKIKTPKVLYQRDVGSKEWGFHLTKPITTPK